MSVESIPRDLRNLRACLLCSMIKTVEQFEVDGCDNCERYLGMKGDEEKVSECTRLFPLIVFGYSKVSVTLVGISGSLLSVGKLFRQLVSAIN